MKRLDLHLQVTSSLRSRIDTAPSSDKESKAVSRCIFKRHIGLVMKVETNEIPEDKTMKHNILFIYC